MQKIKKRNFDAGKTTKTGEMVPSMFNWITPDIQQIRAKRLDEATKKD